jgi:ribonuclease T2
MERLPVTKCFVAGCALLAVLAFSACNRNQAKSLEPPRSAAPLRSPSSQPAGSAGAASAASRPEHEPEATIDAGSATSKFDFYVLALSWAPQFCASHENRSAGECDPSRHYGFVVHGLWPQNNDSTYPVSCTAANPVTYDVIRQTLPIMPSRGLIQHEWAVHGTCSGLASREYFSLMQRAFRELKVPAEYQHPAQAIQASPNEIEQKFASANGAPAEAFRVACSKREFRGVDVCLTKDLHYRSCADAVRECHARQVEIVPSP